MKKLKWLGLYVYNVKYTYYAGPEYMCIYPYADPSIIWEYFKTSSV